MTNSEKRRKRKEARKEPGKPPAKQTKYRQFFVKRLAPEIQLAVVAHLPVKQMQKCRAINRYMRDLIDDEKNQVICAQGCVARAHQPFKTFVKTHIEYDVDAVDEDGNPCGFLNALVAYSKLRGIAEQHCMAYCFNIEYFVTHWLSVCQLKPFEGGPHCSQEDARDTVLALHGLHMAVEGLPFASAGPDGHTIGVYKDKLRQEGTLNFMRVTTGQIEEAVIQKVMHGALDGVAHHREGNLVDCDQYDPPHFFEFELRGQIADLGSPMSRLAITWDPESRAEASGGDTSDGDTSDDDLAQGSASDDQLSETRAEEDWSRVESKKTIRGTTLEELQTNDAADNFSSTSDESLDIFDLDFGSEFDRDNGKLDEVGTALHKQFGLPVLPNHLPFAYYARSPKVVHMLKAVLTGQKKLTLIERAFVLEGIYIW